MEHVHRQTGEPMSHGKSSRPGSAKEPPRSAGDGPPDQGLPSRPFSLPPGYYERYDIRPAEPASGGVQAKGFGLHRGTPIPRGLLEYYGIVPPATAAPAMTEQAPVQGVQTQTHAGASPIENAREWIHEAAAHGTSGASGPLPHLDAIQRSFGRHDVSQIQAHTDRRAAEGAEAMRAEAFARGDRVAFAGTPSLHTASHEAAHVVQQRAGVQLKGGVGEVGDPYEQSMRMR